MGKGKNKDDKKSPCACMRCAKSREMAKKSAKNIVKRFKKNNDTEELKELIYKELTVALDCCT